VAFLLLNLNNSFTKWAVAQDGQLLRVGKMPTTAFNAEAAQRLRKRFHLHDVVAASVVPSHNAAVTEAFGENVFWVRGTVDLGLRVDYPKKSQIGADRLANAMAARSLFGTPAVVVDFGTALTFDVVDPGGAYVGGVICPGLNALTDYLHQRTALLPKISMREPRRAVGRTTVEAMQIGAVLGYRGLVREILAGIGKDLGAGKELHVIATGGQGALVARGLPEIGLVHPTLTLEGLRLIGEYRGMK
jgi:type III pantothenate kinase